MSYRTKFRRTAQESRPTEFCPEALCRSRAAISGSRLAGAELGRQVPDLDAVAARDDAAAVRREGHAAHLLLVPREALQLLPGAEAPDAHAGVLAAGDGQLAVGRKRHAVDAAGVP